MQRSEGEHADETGRELPVAAAPGEAEQQYRSVFEATSEGLVINDLAGRVVEVNPAFCRMHGYTREELIGRDTAELHPPESVPAFKQSLIDVELGREYWTEGAHLHRRKDGTTFHAEVHSTRFSINNTLHVLAVVRDVTERVKAFELLEARVEERTRELTTLLEIATNLASTLELEPMLRLILDQLRLIVDYTGSALVVKREDRLVFFDFRSPYHDPTDPGWSMPIERFTPIWDLLQRGEPVIIADAQDSSPFAQAFRIGFGPEMLPRLNHVRSWLAVPLLHKEQVLGMLSLSHQQPGYYEPRHARLAAAVANQVAVAIENARLVGELQQKAHLEERQRLARELHDSVTQELFSIGLNVRTIELLMEREGLGSASIRDKIADVRQLTKGALAEMRALIFELRPGALQEEGLVEALRKHAAAVAGRQGLLIEVKATTLEVPRLKPQAEEALYRIAQEALHNIVKHAGASQVEIALTVDSERLLLRVSDDGRGFDPATVPVGHLGLGTMGQRAAALGGEFAVDSAPGAGSTVRLILPLTGWRLAAESGLP